MGVRGQRPNLPFYPRERPGTHCMGSWVSPRAGLEKSRPLTGIGFPDRPFSSVSLHGLTIPAHNDSKNYHDDRAGVLCRYSDYEPTGWTIRGSNPRRGEMFFPFSPTPSATLVLTVLHVQRYRGAWHGLKRPELDVDYTCI
jgi:hypothetical protein